MQYTLPGKEDEPLHTIQVPLLPFNDFLRLDRHDRLLAVLQALPAERLLRAVEGDPAPGRRGYPARVLWACLVAGIVYQIPTVAELRRHLATNPQLRLVCGLGSARVPSAPTFTRFLDRLVRTEDQMDQLFTTLVASLAGYLPDLGQSVAVDSTDIHAWARGRSSAADPDASWSAKGTKGPRKDPGEKYWWFGYKLHLAVDTHHELPVAFTVTTAKAADTKELLPLLDQQRARLPQTQPRVVVADAAYDSAANCQGIVQGGAVPIIPLNLGHEQSPPGITNSQGTVLGPLGEPLVFWGRDGASTKWRCPAALGKLACPRYTGEKGVRCTLSSYGLTVKLPLAQDWRRHTPVPRETKKWRRLYRRRTAVERVFGRLKGHLLLDALRVRGLAKVRVRLTLSLVVMLAAALGMAQQQRWPDLRRLVA